jgi:hypothetical protein
MNLETLIKKIRDVIGRENQLTIEFFPNSEICINLYENRIPILIVKNKNECFIEASLIDLIILTVDDLCILVEVCNLINENIQMFKDI